MQLRIVVWSLAFIGLTGCHTPRDVEGFSDYRVCRSHILRPPLASRDALLEADRQVRLRGLDCSRYASAIMQEDANNTQLLQQLSQPQPRTTQTRCWGSGIFVQCTSN